MCKYVMNEEGRDYYLNHYISPIRALGSALNAGEFTVTKFSENGDAVQVKASGKLLNHSSFQLVGPNVIFVDELKKYFKEVPVHNSDLFDAQVTEAFAYMHNKEFDKALAIIKAQTPSWAAYMAIEIINGSLPFSSKSWLMNALYNEGFKEGK